MANCVFAWPNHIDATSPTVVSFSGGSWVSSLPLSNLRDPFLYKVARSSSAALADTQFDVDLGTTVRYGRVFAIPRHNMRETATFRIRGSSDPANFGKAQRLTASSAGGKFTLPVTFSTAGAKYVSVYVKASSVSPSTTFRVRVLDGSSNVRLSADPTIAGDGTVTNVVGTGTSLGTALEDGYTRVKFNTTSATAAGAHTIEIYPCGTAGVDLKLVVYGVYVTESAADTTYAEAGSNKITAPYDFTAWTATNAAVDLSGMDEPNGPQTYDSAWQDVWPVMWPENVLPWGHPNVWTRRLNADQVEFYRAGLVHVAPVASPGRYWRFEFNDTTNPDGYIQLHRLVLSQGYVPSINMQFGATLGLQDTTTYEEALGGPRFYDERPQRRVMAMTFDDLPEDELLGVMQEMQRSLGISKQVFFIHAEDDTVHLVRRAMLATIKELSPLEYAYFGRGKMPLVLEEVL